MESHRARNHWTDDWWISGNHFELTSLRRMLLRVLALALVFWSWLLKECPVEYNGNGDGSRLYGHPIRRSVPFLRFCFVDGNCKVGFLMGWISGGFCCSWWKTLSRADLIYGHSLFWVAVRFKCRIQVKTNLWKVEETLEERSKRCDSKTFSRT